MSKKKRLLISVSGGTAAPMCITLMYIVNMFSEYYELWALPEIWKAMSGLIPYNCYRITPEMVKDWGNYGGSPFLASCKNTNVFAIDIGNNITVDYSSKVKDFYNRMNFDGVVIVGGGGTTHQTAELIEKYPEMNFMVLLATMDNDVSIFDNSLGFLTAVEKASESIESNISDSLTMKRPSITFTMGYDCGRVAYYASMNVIKKLPIDLLYLPESQTDVNNFAYYLKENFKGKGTFNVISSEGVCKSSKVSKGVHKKYNLNDFVSEVEQKSGISLKMLPVDYRQRAAIPVQKDVELAFLYVKKAYELIKLGIWNQVIGGNEAVNHPIDLVSKIIKEQGSDWNTWFGDIEKPTFLVP